MGRTIINIEVTVKCFFAQKTLFLLDFLFFFGDIYEILRNKLTFLRDKFESKICTKYSFYNVDCEMEYRLYTATQGMVRYILKEYDTYLTFEYECPNITNIKLF